MEISEKKGIRIKTDLARFAWVSIAAAILTITLKTVAYIITDSVGLLSDALESCINLAGAIMALSMLIIAARPADEDHSYGHHKAEYFSSGVEGILIILAAILIGITAVQRFLDPKPIEQPGMGLLVSIAASLINLVVAVVLSKAGKKHQSITLEADAKHLMTDVWTSVGVLIGVAAVFLTGWLRLDSIVAFLVACNIIWSGISILRKSVGGLMDSSLPSEDLSKVNMIFESYRVKGIDFHALRSRQAAARKFISFHVLVPGAWTVQQGHTLLESIESDMRKAIENSTINTHLEPIEDSSSFNDMRLDREIEL
jgi:cation diffusion facilitator family transporter